MLVKIEARILIFPGTDFHFPSTSVPPGTFLGSVGLWFWSISVYTSGVRKVKVNVAHTRLPSVAFRS